MLAALEANQFNLSSVMGDLFAEAVKLGLVRKDLRCDPTLRHRPRSRRHGER